MSLTKEEYDAAYAIAVAKAEKADEERRKIEALHRAAPEMLAVLERTVGTGQAYFFKNEWEALRDLVARAKGEK